MKKLSLAALTLSLVLGQNVFAAAETDVNHKPGMTGTPPTATMMNSSNTMQQCHHHHLCYHHIKEMLQGLNLDSAQQAKVKSIQDQLKADQKPNWDQMKSLKTQFRPIVESDNIDNAKLDSLIQQKKEVLGKIIKARVIAMHDIFHTLNDQQKSKLKEMIQKCEQEHNNDTDK